MTILILLFQFTWATLLLGRTDRHTRIKRLSKMMKKGSWWRRWLHFLCFHKLVSFYFLELLWWKRAEYVEPVVGALLSRAGWLAHGDASERSCHSQSCTFMPFCTRPSMWQEWQLLSSSEAAAVEALSLSLTHFGCTICTCADPFGWRTLWHTPCTALVGGKSHSDYRSVLSDRATQTIGLCCQTVQKSSVDQRHADLHRFHLGLFQAPQPPILARVPLHLMSNDAKHGQFRRLFKNPAGDWQRHPANALYTWRGVDFFCGMNFEFFFEWAIALGGTDPEGEPEPG